MGLLRPPGRGNGITEETHIAYYSGTPAVRLGLRENLARFSLLVLVNAFVGAMAGMERSWIVAGLTLVSGVVVASRMTETERLDSRRRDVDSPRITGLR